MRDWVKNGTNGFFAVKIRHPNINIVNEEYVPVLLLLVGEVVMPVIKMD